MAGDERSTTHRMLCLRCPLKRGSVRPTALSDAFDKRKTHLLRNLSPTPRLSGHLKGTVHPVTGHERPEKEWRYSSTLSLTSALDGGGWSTPRPGRFTPGRDPVPIVQEAGWTPGPVWTDAENLAHTRIRSPDRSARSESLYRLSYRGPTLHILL